MHLQSLIWCSWHQRSAEARGHRLKAAELLGMTVAGAGESPTAVVKPHVNQPFYSKWVASNHLKLEVYDG